MGIANSEFLGFENFAASEPAAMGDFKFKVDLVAVVRVRASDPTVARAAVPTVLEAPSSTEIDLANQNNAGTGLDAKVTGVDFYAGPIKPLKP